MAQTNPVKRRLWRCGYCHEKVTGSGFWGSRVLYCSSPCRELGIAMRSKKAPDGWAWLVLLFFIANWVVFPRPAWAHDPLTHQSDALSDARSEQYGVCCNGDDYIRNPPYETTPTGWRVYANGRWFDVSRRAMVSNMKNPDGDAKVWINGTPSDLYVRCFLPGAMF